MANTETENAMTEARTKALQGDASRVEKQHASGKKTARERIASLFDGGSFMELETLRKDANLVAGCGTVQLRPVYCFAQDFTSSSGAMTASQSRKIAKVLDMASSNGAPVVAMIDSAGVKVTEGVSALPAYAEIFSKMAKLSGISGVLYPACGYRDPGKENRCAEPASRFGDETGKKRGSAFRRGNHERAGRGGACRGQRRGSGRACGGTARISPGMQRGGSADGGRG